MKNPNAIDKFAKDISCLDVINKELSTINIFEILKIDQIEIRHSNMLGWLLDPKSESGIKDKLLKQLVYYCVDHTPDSNIHLSPTKIELMDFNDAEVYREKETDKKKRIDLLILSPKSGLVICIENKINSTERKDRDGKDGQLKDYEKYITQQYNNSKYKYIFYVFLTPTGIEASNDNSEKWITISYNEIFVWIKSIVDTYQDSINEKSLFLIKEYLDNLSRNVIDTRLKTICDEVYLKHIDAFNVFEKIKAGNHKTNDAEKLYILHKQAIDYILEKKTSQIDLIKAAIRDRFIEKGYKATFSPNRAQIYIKVPQRYYDNLDESIVDRTKETRDSDYLYYQVSYSPKAMQFYLQLYSNSRNLPKKELETQLLNAFRDLKRDSNNVPSVDSSNQRYSKKVSEKADYEKYVNDLKGSKTRPSKNDDFIKQVVEKAINNIVSQEHRKFWDALK